MRRDQFLTNQQKHELIQYLGEAGRNYPKYLKWCEIRNVRPFTKDYLDVWIQRRVQKVQIAREQAMERVQKLSQYDRDRRINELEQAIEVINGYLMSPEIEPHECTKCEHMHSPETPKDMIALMEQKRKLLESVAKERGEWLKNIGTESDGIIDHPAERLRIELAKALANPSQGIESTERPKELGENNGSVRGPVLLLSTEGDVDEQADTGAPVSEE